MIHGFRQMNETGDAQERMFTARAANRPTVSNDALDSIMNSNLARTLSGSVSVGEKAVA
jgi:hypothetical protein